jgi:hypothetical protein
MPGKDNFSNNPSILAALLFPTLGRRVEVNNPPFDADCHALRHAGGHGLTGAGEDAAESLPGNSHQTGGVDLGHALDIRQSQGLKLIERENAFSKVAQRNARRLEKHNTRQGGDAAGTMRAGHARIVDHQ